MLLLLIGFYLGGAVAAFAQVHSEGATVLTAITSAAQWPSKAVRFYR